MTTIAFILILFGTLVILSVALNSWGNAWNVLTGKAASVDSLFKGSATPSGTTSSKSIALPNK